MYNHDLVNCDTDSIMITKIDRSIWSKEEQISFLNELNKQFPEKIKFEHDGIFQSVAVFGSKNYALLPEGSNKIKLKGSSIKDQKKEPALLEMMTKIIDAMVYEKFDTINDIYKSYIKEALNVKDIHRWAKKISVSEAILACANPTEETRKNEMDVWDAIKNEEDKQQGNKFYIYPVIIGTHVESNRISEKTGKPLKDKVTEITGYKLDKYWNNDHNVDKLIERVYSTLEIFKLVLDLTQFVDYTANKNKLLLQEIINEISLKES